MQVFFLDMERMYEGPYFNVLQAIHDLATCPIDSLGPHPHLKQLRKDLLLTEAHSETVVKLTVPFFSSEGEMTASAELEQSLQRIIKASESLIVLGLGEAFSKSIWSVFGAVYHLGHVVGTLGKALKNVPASGATGNSAKEVGRSASHSRLIDSGQQHFKSACSLLGLSVENVEKTLVLDADQEQTSRIRNVLGFSLGLYFECVNSLFTTINKSNSVGYRNIQCLTISVAQLGFSPETLARQVIV